MCIYQGSIDQFRLAKEKAKRMIDRFKEGKLDEEEQYYLACLAMDEDRELMWLKDHGQLLDEEGITEMIGRLLMEEKE